MALINPQKVPNVIEFQTKWNHFINGRYYPHKREDKRIIRGRYEEDKTYPRGRHGNYMCVSSRNGVFFFFAIFDLISAVLKAIPFGQAAAVL